jgi:hypothetical protein
MMATQFQLEGAIPKEELRNLHTNIILHLLAKSLLMTTDKTIATDPKIAGNTDIEARLELLETTPTKNIFYLYTTRMALRDGILYEPYPKTCPDLFLSMGIFRKIHDFCRANNEDTDDVLREIISAVVLNVPRLTDAIQSREAVTFDSRIGTLQVLTNESKGATVILADEY